MNAIIKGILTLPVAAALAGCCNSNVGTQPAQEKATEYVTEKAYDVPAFEKGYEHGVSAMYTATTDDALYIAGGCNFPDVPAAEGGKKVYYKGIYRIATDVEGKWEMIGELPEASAYGVCVQSADRWIIAGGMNSEGASDRVYSIDLATMQIDTLPSLPCTVDNAAGAIADNTLYIAGGNGKAGNMMFALDMQNGTQWNELPKMPSQPRVQPVLAAARDAIYVWGGFSPATEEHEAIVHTDGVKYDIAAGEWQPIGDVTADGKTVTLSGGTAIAINDSTIIATGGVDKDIFLDAISGRYELVAKSDYMYKPAGWYRFNSRLMQYSTANGEWSVLSDDSRHARAGALLVKQKNSLYLVCGELKPGIRSTEISRISIR